MLDAPPDEEVPMKALVVYESMYGNTHLIAEAIGDGLRPDLGVDVVPVGRAGADALADVDLLVVGGPTHVHGVSRASTRAAAVEAAAKPGADLDVDPDAEGDGLREWFDGLAAVPRHAAAFDTRLRGPAAVTGRASKGIAKRLRAHGATLVTDPESFLVTKETHLVPDEVAHARAWGAQLARAAAFASRQP
jgi:hypothetical protein